MTYRNFSSFPVKRLVDFALPVSFARTSTDSFLAISFRSSCSIPVLSHPTSPPNVVFLLLSFYTTFRLSHFISPFHLQSLSRTYIFLTTIRHYLLRTYSSSLQRFTSPFDYYFPFRLRGKTCEKQSKRLRELSTESLYGWRFELRRNGLQYSEARTKK